MAKLVDSENVILFTGDTAYLSDIIRILTTLDITEEDEIKYKDIVFDTELEWTGELKIIE